MKNKHPTEPLSINQSTLIAAAGEYYVLARLSLCGKIAAQAPRGAPNADIVVTSVSGDRLCAVQVKARQGLGADGGWHMSKKHETIKAPGLFELGLRDKQLGSNLVAEQLDGIKAVFLLIWSSIRHTIRADPDVR